MAMTDQQTEELFALGQRALEWLIENDPEGAEEWEAQAAKDDPKHMIGLVAAVATNLADFGSDEAAEAIVRDYDALAGRVNGHAPKAKGKRKRRK